MIDYFNAFFLFLLNVPYVGYFLATLFIVGTICCAYLFVHFILTLPDHISTLLKNRELSETMLILIVCIFILRVLFLTF